MELSDVNKILDIYHSNDYSQNFEYYDLHWKKNRWLRISNYEEFDFVKEAINTDIHKINPKYEIGDFITLLVYERGDFFGKHIDGPSYITTKKKTVLTGGYLLNNNYTGGEFIVENKELQVQLGELFVFGREEYHEVKKVISGIRYSLHFAINIDNDKVLI